MVDAPPGTSVAKVADVNGLLEEELPPPEEEPPPQATRTTSEIKIKT